LSNRLHLSPVEFNSTSVAGRATSERLMEMLNLADFAFLILTGEDEKSDGKLNPRLNVDHESGLFQGKLGFEKARRQPEAASRRDVGHRLPLFTVPVHSRFRFEPNSADPRPSTAYGRYTGVAAVSVQPLSSASLGTRILRAETGGRIQAQSVGERPEFGSQTGRGSLTSRNCEGFYRPGNRVGLPGLDGGGRSPGEPVSHGLFSLLTGKVQGIWLEK
jgi:hypothetical protein